MATHHGMDLTLCFGVVEGHGQSHLRKSRKWGGGVRKQHSNITFSCLDLQLNCMCSHGECALPTCFGVHHNYPSTFGCNVAKSYHAKTQNSGLQQLQEHIPRLSWTLKAARDTIPLRPRRLPKAIWQLRHLHSMNEDTIGETHVSTSFPRNTP